MRLAAPSSPRLDDPRIEEARRTLDRAVRELQGLPASSLTVLGDVVLADGVRTTLTHRLGRAPRWVGVSVVRGAVSTGRVEEIREGGDRSRGVVLLATGYGGPVTVDVVVL